MRKHLGVLVVAAMLVTSMATVFAADSPKKASDPKMVKFNKEFCKTTSRNPLITVCVGGNPEQTAFTKGTERALKSGTKKLLAQYSKSNKEPGHKFLTSTCTYFDWDPAECDPMNMGRSFCQVNMMDPQCTTNCERTDWIPHVCDPVLERSWCTINSGSPYCATSACDYNDWIPEVCDPMDMGRSFCQVNTMDPQCI